MNTETETETDGTKHCAVCKGEATRELHSVELDEWFAYCDDHTPVGPTDNERSLEGDS